MWKYLNKITIPYIVIVGLLIYIYSIDNDVKIVEIQSKKNTKIVEKPIEVIRTDTVYLSNNSVVVERVENPINKALEQKYYKALNQRDSIEQLRLYKDAITERRYIEYLNDSVQDITVISEVVGRLKRQQISYKTKKVSLQIRDRKKPLIFIGGFTSLSNNNVEGFSVGAKLNYLTPNKKKIIGIGFDSDKRIHLGITFKIL